MSKPDDVFNAQLAEEAVKRTANLNNQTIDLALRLKEARDFMAWSTAHMRESWLEWIKESDKASKDLNLFRMAFDRESKSVIQAGKDVRDFFNSPDYGFAHAKLNEMVALLDRFEHFKKNGTLDAFADFILKVSCK